MLLSVPLLEHSGEHPNSGDAGILLRLGPCYKSKFPITYPALFALTLPHHAHFMISNPWITFLFQVCFYRSWFEPMSRYYLNGCQKNKFPGVTQAAYYHFFKEIWQSLLIVKLDTWGCEYCLLFPLIFTSKQNKFLIWTV